MYIPPILARLLGAPLTKLTVGVALACALLAFWGDALLIRLAADLPHPWQRLWTGVSLAGHPLLMLGVAAVALLGLFGLRRSLTVPQRDRLRLFGWSLPANWIATEWLQFLFARHPAPDLVYNNTYGYTFLNALPGLDGFPAAPASGVAALALLVGMTWPRWQRLALGYAVLVCWSLFFSLQHFPADIVAGALLGVLVVRGVQTLQYHWT